MMSGKEAVNKLLAMVNASGLQRVEVAEYLGVSERTLYRWLSGTSSFPRMVFIAMRVLLQKKK